MKSRRKGFTLIELLVVIAIIGILATFLAPSILSAQNRANKQKCANNLKGIGIALLLYAGDYRFFPHMAGLKSQNTPQLVSRVFETLIFFKTYDNPEGLVCPSGEEEPKQLAESVRDDPRTINLDDSNNDGTGGDRDTKPVRRGSSTAIMDNPYISYTYIRRRLNQNSARSDNILCTDKDFRKPDVSGSGTETSTTSGSRISVGCHDDGFNVLHVDGHASFLPLPEDEKVTRMVNRLVFDSTNAQADFGN